LIVTKKVPHINATHFHQVALPLYPTPNGHHQCSKLLFGHQMEEIVHRHCCLGIDFSVPFLLAGAFLLEGMDGVA
jgi:hypothetical protein